MSLVTSLFRRLAVPLVGAGLLVIIVVVSLVILDLGGSPGDAGASLTAIQIGGISLDQEGSATTSMEPATSTAPGSHLGAQGPESGRESEQSQSEGQGSGTSQGQDGVTGPGSTIQAGKTTVVTEGIRIQQRPGRQDGSTTTTGTTDPGSPTSPGTAEGTTTTSGQGSASTGGTHGSSSSGGTQTPSTTGAPDGGMHGAPSTGHGR
ncbi:MAG: hypothetical protein JXA87_15135 [Thermoleophilia bacterium]|nr:hypothetical protein [Thermoleophilia bacterium]